MKLGLGTVQFGIDYGVSNFDGKTPIREVEKILITARNNGMEIIDTAPSYGDSETTLGIFFTETCPFKVVTKTPHFSGESAPNDLSRLLETAFMASLEKMHLNSVYGLLVHNAEDLFSENGIYIMNKIETLKERGLIQNIGVSIYTVQQLDKILDHYQIDIIQLPVNVLDQRLIQSGHLKKLADLGVEIHVRSAFLQGILLMEPNNLPFHFDPAKDHLQRFRRLLEQDGLTPLQGAIGFLNTIPEIDCVICGVNSNAQLEEICLANKPLPIEIDFSDFALQNENILNPQLWPH